MSSKKEKGSGSKKGKKVSKSKAKLAAEAARLAEEAQRAAEAEQERQRFEAIKIAEEEARRAAEKAEFDRLEAERLAEESVQDTPFLVAREAELSSLEEKLESDREWKTYLQCNPLPDVREESQLNAYIALWKSAHSHSDTLDGTSAAAPIHTYYDKLISSCAITESLVDQLYQLSGESREEFAHTRHEWCDSMLKQLRDITSQKLDYLTAQFLTRADEYEDYESKTMQQSHYTEEIQYGLWVHTSAKHGRVKKIEFDSLQLVIELPVALQKSRTSIRVIRTAFDSTALKFDHRYSTQQPSWPLAVNGSIPPLHFTSIGGLISIDQCVLPPAPKKAKGWMIREITPLSKTVQLIPYPAQNTANNANPNPLASPSHGGGATELASPTNGAPAAGGPPNQALSGLPLDDPSAPSTTTQAPLRVTFTLPRHLFLDDREPHFGWFDSRHSCWRQEGIQVTSFDPQTGKVSINLALLKPFAVIQPRALDFPYREWHLSPLERSTDQRLTLIGSRFPVQFDIRSTECRLEQPRSPALQKFNESYSRPGHLLYDLSRLGLNVQPSLDDALYCRKPIKDSPFSSVLHEQIAFLSSIFNISHSTFNSSRGPQQSLFRVRLNRPQMEWLWSRFGAEKRKIFEKLIGDAKEERRKEAERMEKEREAEEKRKREAAGVVDEEESSASLDTSTDKPQEQKPEESQQQASEPAPVQPNGAVDSIEAIPPEILKAQRYNRSQDWLVVHAQQVARPTKAQQQEAADSAPSKRNHDINAPLVTFTTVRGLDLSGLVDLSAADSSQPHISLRRSIYSYLRILYPEDKREELENIGLLLDLYEDLDGEIRYLPSSSDTLLMQQTVKRMLNLTQPFTFH